MPRHEHHCSTKGCPHFWVCTQRDCRQEWQCPSCEDDEIFNDIERMDAQSRAVKEPAVWQS